MSNNPFGPRPGGTNGKFNIAANNLVTTGNGTLYVISVTATSTSPGAVYDSVSIAGVGASNLIAVIPAVVGVYQIVWPYNSGIVIEPGASQIISVSYS